MGHGCEFSRNTAAIRCYWLRCSLAGTTHPQYFAIAEDAVANSVDLWPMSADKFRKCIVRLGTARKHADPDVQPLVFEKAFVLRDKDQSFRPFETTIARKLDAGLRARGCG